MRIFLCTCLLMLLSACATQRSVAPTEYLDEQTAATITKVAEPWVFNREGAPVQLDFVHLYALDVNRMGNHQIYLVVLKHWAAPDLPEDRAPQLEVQTTDASALSFEALSASARELGIGQPLDPMAPRGVKYWCYPITAEQLSLLSRSGDTRVTLIVDGTRATYVVWRDAQSAFSAFVDAVN